MVKFSKVTQNTGNSSDLKEIIIFKIRQYYIIYKMALTI